LYGTVIMNNGAKTNMKYIACYINLSTNVSNAIYGNTINKKSELWSL